jgi:hypothetical protein
VFESWASGEINSAKAGQQLNKLFFLFLSRGQYLAQLARAFGAESSSQVKKKKKTFLFYLFFFRFPSYQKGGCLNQKKQSRS